MIASYRFDFKLGDLVVSPLENFPGAFLLQYKISYLLVP
jgi:hypothetical protein